MAWKMANELSIHGTLAVGIFGIFLAFVRRLSSFALFPSSWAFLPHRNPLNSIEFRLNVFWLYNVQREKIRVHTKIIGPEEQHKTRYQRKNKTKNAKHKK